MEETLIKANLKNLRDLYSLTRGVVIPKTVSYPCLTNSLRG
jgi:hypothetical protein